MNDSGSKGGGEFRFFHAMVFLGILALLSGCGGGVGGVDVTPPDPNLDYVLGPPRGGVAPLTVTGPLSRFILASIPPVSDGPYMAGTIDKATLDTTITGNTAVPVLWPDTATPTGDPLFGNLSVTVSQTFRWNGASDPTAGEFLITSRNGFFPGRIRARVAVQSGVQGVLSEYDDNSDGIYAPGVFHPWGSFYDLWTDDLKPIYERASSFVYSTRQTIFSLMDLAMETTNAIEDHRAELQAAGSDNAIQVECDALPGESPGSYSIAWTDVNGNGRIDYDLSGAQQHDTFAFTINQCWIDDPSDPEDLLLNGVIGLAYYEPHLQWGPVFDNLVVTPTLDNVAVPGSSMTVNGGFSLFVPGY